MSSMILAVYSLFFVQSLLNAHVLTTKIMQQAALVLIGFDEVDNLWKTFYKLWAVLAKTGVF